MTLDIDHKILVKLSGIKKSFYEKDVLKGLDLTLRDKEVHGLLGVNGAGKSTLMNILLKILDKSSGEMEFDPSISIGYLPERPPLYKNMKVVEFLKFARSIYSQEKSRDIDELLKTCELINVKDQVIRNLSKGYRQRVGLAAAICHDPKLLVLDEPFSGLDPHAVISFKELIFKLSKDHSILISSHQLSELSQICSRITVIHDGLVAKSGLIDEVLKDIEGKISIEVEFDEINSEILADIANELGCVYESSGNKVLFHFQMVEDARFKLSKYFIDKKIVVLSQKERKLTLEDIFKEITH